MKSNQTNSIFLFGKTKRFTAAIKCVLFCFTFAIAGIDSSATDLKADALSAWRTNVYIVTVLGTSLKVKTNSSEIFDKNKKADGINFNVFTDQRTPENSIVNNTFHHIDYQNVMVLAIRGVFTVESTGPYLFNFNDVGTAGIRHTGTVVRLLVNGITRAVAYDRLRHQKLSNLPIVLLHLKRGDRVHVFVSARIPVNGTDDDYAPFSGISLL
ncbi:hypothetical protein GHT06_022849 [Daphnia sinensis]|uniref:C1q domain-containing protein n=1 Tax=Daphnia sinensis TaxID=1820382 RepID=A0AAD5L7H8_9CRUS|nr:hypothetical protein GHT06_022849 [Daphnia sinensis]